MPDEHDGRDVGQEDGQRPAGSCSRTVRLRPSARWIAVAGEAADRARARRGAGRRRGGSPGRGCGRRSARRPVGGRHVPTSRKTSSRLTVRFGQAAQRRRRVATRASRTTVVQRRRPPGAVGAGRRPGGCRRRSTGEPAAHAGRRPSSAGALVDLDQQARGPAPVSSAMAPAATTRPLAEDDGVVADPLDLLEQVRRQDDVDAELGADPADEGQHVVALHRVEPVGGLVEQHEVRVVGDGLGQLHPLALAGRHGADGPEALLAQADLPEGVAGPAGGLAVWAGRGPRRCGGRGPGRVVSGGQGVVLGRVADPLADLGARPSTGSSPSTRELALGRGGAGRASCPSRVVLPAPFAPSRPVMPGPIVKVAPSRAVVAPQRLTIARRLDHDGPTVAASGPRDRCGRIIAGRA